MFNMAQIDNHRDPNTRQGQLYRKILAPHYSTFSSCQNAGKTLVAKNNVTHPFPPCSTWPSAETVDIHFTVDDQL